MTPNEKTRRTHTIGRTTAVVLGILALLSSSTAARAEAGVRAVGSCTAARKVAAHTDRARRTSLDQWFSTSCPKACLSPWLARRTSSDSRCMPYRDLVPSVSFTDDLGGPHRFGQR